MAVAFVTWLWGQKYSPLDVCKLADGIRRNTNLHFRFIVVTDQQLKNSVPSYVEIIPLPNPELIGRGCFCRLRMFDPEWQQQNKFDDRIVSIDLDAVITGNVDQLFNGNEKFLILQGVNAVNPNPFNCSVMMLKSGACSNAWTEFSMEKTKQIVFHEFPDDQGWIWHLFPNACGWRGGEISGIYAFQKPGWPYSQSIQYLPYNARIVTFIGWRKPKDFADLPWMMQHWRLGR